MTNHAPWDPPAREFTQSCFEHKRNAHGQCVRCNDGVNATCSVCGRALTSQTPCSPHAKRFQKIT